MGGCLSGPGGGRHPEGVLDELLASLASRGRSTVVHPAPGADPVTAGGLLREVCATAAGIAGVRAAGGPGSVWVSASDRFRFLVAALGALASGPVALVDPHGPAGSFDAMAAGCPPALVVADSAALDVVSWARQRAVAVHIAAAGAAPADSVPVTAAPLQFFSSGTTGPMKCVTVGPEQLAAAVHGVAARLRLSEEDVSLAVAPLPHTLGFVTTVLAAVASGGAVALADPTRSRDLLETVRTTAPTWCAASPSLHLMVHRATRGAGLAWPRLRFLRSSAAPMRDELADELEASYGVPLVNAYAMTEAPGEIASHELGGRCPGTVGRPSLCEVSLRPVDGGPLPDGAGEIWIRGPNVAPTGVPASGGWRATADLGVLEPDGQLRITGRLHDVINQGGLKVWPREVEDVVLQHRDVGTAVAFPVRDAKMGEKVGLAVVARPGRTVDRATVRRAFLGALPREKWPGVIVVCDRIPLTARGKVDRRNLARLLHVDAT